MRRSQAVFALLPSEIANVRVCLWPYDLDGFPDAKGELASLARSHCSFFPSAPAADEGFSPEAWRARKPSNHSK